MLGQPHLRELGIELYSFKTIPSSKRLDIRLDKTGDRYGSPSLEDVEVFSRDFGTRLEAELVRLSPRPIGGIPSPTDSLGPAACSCPQGEKEAGEIEIEVSSPGAERLLRVPEDLDRFRELPMRVEYEIDSGSGK